jgi:DNA repair ATPase RecN
MLAPEPISNDILSTGISESIKAASSKAVSDGIYDDAAASNIQNPLRGDIASIQQSIKEAGLAISWVQKLRESLDRAKGTLGKMREYLKEIASAKNSEEEKVKLWGEVKSVAEDYNEMIERIGSDSRKMLASDGESISIPVGEDSNRSIIADNLRFDIEDLNVFGNSRSLVEKMVDAMEAIRAFDGFLIGVSQRIEKVATHVQFELAEILDVVENIKERNRNLEIDFFSLTQMLERAYEAMRGQANIEPETAVELLLDPIGSPAEDRILEDILAESTEEEIT